MDGIQRIAYRNIKACFNWEVGGWYNCIQDGCPEYIPETLAEAKDIIYEGAMTNLYRTGYCGCNKAPREMRFAGEKFIRDVIDKLFEQEEDGDVGALTEEKGW